MCKSNTRLIYVTFLRCTNKFEKHKHSFLSENYEHTFPNKNHKKITYRWKERIHCSYTSWVTVLWELNQLVGVFPPF